MAYFNEESTVEQMLINAAGQMRFDICGACRRASI